MTERPNTTFEAHIETWSALAQRSPFWAILSHPGTDEAEWDARAFFQDGEGFGRYVARHTRELGLSLQTERALDFGCGLGRLTQALALWFEEVDGVDVAAPMIEGARKYNQHGARCRYHHNERLDLALFEDASFDFVISVLVLQHMRPEFMKDYLREFFRILRPGGIAFFQLPTEPLIPDSYDSERGAAQTIPPLREAPRSYEVSLRVRPTISGVFRGTIKDVQAVVRNESATYLSPRTEVVSRFRSTVSDAIIQGTEASVQVGQYVAPGQEAIVILPLIAPAELDYYILEVTVVSPVQSVPMTCPPVRTPIHTTRFDLAQISDEDVRTAFRATKINPGVREAGEIEVYELCFDAVVETIEAAGGRVVHHVENDWAGPDYISCQFTAVREWSVDAAPTW